MFKYVFSFLLLIASACGCNSTKPADEQAVCGGYGNETAITSEDLAVWNEAIESRPDLKDYKPMTARRQVVAGMNYDFTCRDKQGNTATVKIFKPLPGEGSAEVTYPRKD